MTIDPDAAIEASRVFMDRCFADPELHEYLSDQKASMLVALQRMAIAQRERGRTDAADYVEDMAKRLKHWQFQDSP